MKVAIVIVEEKMGYRKPMDYNSVRHQIYMSGVEILDPRNDGYTQWYIKQDLYRVKWLIDAILNESSTFVGEEEFLKEHEQKVMWRNLQK